jgi:hypothetical protein
MFLYHCVATVAETISMRRVVVVGTHGLDTAMDAI